MKHPPANIIALFNRGDSEALAYIFEQHHRALCFFAERLTSDRQESEDIVADAFMKLWRKRTDFETLQNIKAFLYITVRNACFDFLKHRKRASLSHQEILYMSATGDDALLNTLIETEMLQHVYTEIKKLPKKCRTVFELYHFEGLDTNQIASRLNISNQNVLNQKARAIKLLRIFLLRKKFMLLMLAALGAGSS